MSDYLNSRISMEHFNIYYEDSKGTAIPPDKETNYEFCYNSHFKTKHIYGVECYRFVNDYLKYIIHNLLYSRIDIRIFRLLMEHKRLMVERLKHYHCCDYFNVDISKYIEIAGKISEEFSKIFYSILKNRIKRGIGDNLLIKVKNKIIEYAMIEEEYLNDVLLKI